MKKIICYGDSNTFGFNPENRSRYGSNIRWTGVLANLLKDKFIVVEEGCNNRTAFFHNPDGVLQSGQEYLPLCLEVNKNVDIFILALGTNDLQKYFKLTEAIVKQGLEKIVSVIRMHNPDSKIIIVQPVKIDERALIGTFGYQFDKSSIENAIWIQDLYKKFAKISDCELFDFNDFVNPSNIDGLHYDEKSHSLIAEKIASKILEFSENYAENC